MRIDHLGGFTFQVVLSRRNLRALLAKLDDPNSQRTLYQWSPDGTAVVAVSAEDDAEHYRNRTPGVMHPRTEAALRFREMPVVASLAVPRDEIHIKDALGTRVIKVAAGNPIAGMATGGGPERVRAEEQTTPPLPPPNRRYLADDECSCNSCQPPMEALG